MTADLTADLTGGLDPAVDYPITDPAVGAQSGENHAFWVFEEHGELALLNCHLQAGDTAGYTATTAHGALQEGNAWKTRRESFALVLPHDRLLVDWATGTNTTDTAVGAAGWTFRCDEPFRRWTGTYRGNARETTPTDMQAGMIDLAGGTRTAVECDLEMTMAVPPWIAGAFAEDLPGRAQGLLFEGIPRYEQLYRVTGSLRADGTERTFSGTGLRTHRYGHRDVTGIAGHSWLSAVFPSGRAFGVKRFPKPDGTILASEGWTAEPGRPLVGAKVIDSPWMTSLDDKGETFTIAITTPEGEQLIDGTLLATSYTMALGVNHAPGSWVIGHGMARYTWDGEESCGLIERSAPVETLVAGIQ